MTSPHPLLRRCLPALVALATSAPALAWAKTDTCTNPLDASRCVGVFSMVSLSYVVMIGPIMACALLILKPRFASTRAWTLSLLATPLVLYVLTMVGFTLADLTGLLSFPHDVSPFFYMDWSVLVFVAAGALLTTVGIARKWASRPPSAHTA